MIKWIRSRLGDSLLLNSYLITAMRILGTGFGFLFWVLAARKMPPEEIGLGSGIVSATTLLASLAQLGLGHGLVRHLAHSKQPNKLVNPCIVISGTVGVALAIIYIVGLGIWSPAMFSLRDSFWTVAAFVAFVLAETVSQLLYYVFLAARRMEFSLIKQTTKAILVMVLLPILSPLFAVDHLTILVSYLLATWISVAVSFGICLPIAQPGYKFRIKSAITLRSSFAAYSIVNYVANQIDRAPDTLLPLVVLNVLGPGPAAYFFVAWAMGRGIGGWASGIADSFFAEGSAHPDRAGSLAWRSVKMGLLLAGALSVAMLIGGRLVLSAYGSDYVANSTTLLYLTATAAFLEVLQSIFASYLRVRDRLKAVIVMLSCSNAFGILSCWAGMVLLGLVGIGVGWLVSQSLCLIGVGVWWGAQLLRDRQGLTVPVLAGIHSISGRLSRDQEAQGEGSGEHQSG